MNFDEYQLKARSTAIYPVAAQTIYPALGICGEGGEVAELVKKWLRDEDGHPEYGMSEERVGKLFLELGDVMWYVANLATDLGLSLEDIAQANLGKLAARKDAGTLHGSGDSR